MIIRAPRPDTHYTVLHNATIRDTRLTWKARGLLAYLLSLPDNWRVSSEHLRRVGPDGRDAVRTALTELEAAGYLRRTRHQDPRTGRWTTLTTVYDRPCEQPAPQSTDTPTTDDGLSGAGQSGV